MSDQADLTELIEYLVRSSRLSAAEANRVVNEVLAYLDEAPEAFIRRRHFALQAQGYSNTEIFARLSRELQQWRFRSPQFSERQIRRIIYG